MPEPFLPLSADEFGELVATFLWPRAVKSVQVRQSSDPDLAADAGWASVKEMSVLDHREQGYTDLAQHVTVDGQGILWTGRSWTADPPLPGQTAEGAFLVVVIGNFVLGRDALKAAQRDAATLLVAALLKRFGLPLDALQFPAGGAANTALPAEAREQFSTDVAARMGAANDVAARDVQTDHPEIAEKLLLLKTLLATPPFLPQTPSGRIRQPASVFAFGGAPATATVESGPTIALESHVVNTRAGAWAPSAFMDASRAQAEQIFQKDLRAAALAAQQQNKPLHVLLWAHGGLVAEKDALNHVRRYAPWWKQQNIYPLYFVWRTGFKETIGQMLEETRSRARGMFPFGVGDVITNYITDPLLENVSRHLEARVGVWKKMKTNAGENFAGSGAGLETLDWMRAFSEEFGDSVRWHLVGHSAGAIFHSHLLPEAARRSLRFRSLALLAPAVRVDDWLARVPPAMLARTIDIPPSIFSMSDSLEVADNCADIYRKSLLYLIYYSLEAEQRQPILGLQIAAEQEAHAYLEEVKAVRVYSRSAGDGINSNSATHGGFDDDEATLGSVAFRVLM